MKLGDILDDEGILSEEGLKWFRSLDRYQVTYFLKGLFIEGLNQDIGQLIDEYILKGV